MMKYYKDEPYSVFYSEDKKTLVYGNVELRAYQVLPGTVYLGARCWENLLLTQTITLPEGIVEIGDEAFAGCKSLTNINIPSTVRYIGSGAFEQTRINEIFIPNGVKVIEHDTFDGCFGLETCYLPDSLERIEDYAFNCCINTKIFIYADVRKLNYIDSTAIGNRTVFVVRYHLQKEYMEAFPEFADRFFAMDANEETMKGTIYSPKGEVVHVYNLVVHKE